LCIRPASRLHKDEPGGNHSDRKVRLNRKFEVALHFSVYGVNQAFDSALPV